jgi:mycothiol synthase
VTGLSNITQIGKSRQESEQIPQMEIEKMISLDIEKTRVQADQFKLRPARIEDAEAAFELFDTCSKHMIGISETTLAHVKTEWTSPGFDLENSVRIVEAPDGKIVGFVEVWDIDDPPVSIWVWGRVHPDFEDQGIGKKLMQFAETRSRQAITRAPKDARIVMRSGTPSQYDPAHQLLASLDMNFVRHFFTMAINLNGEPEVPSWPAGIHVRSMNGIEELRSVALVDRDVFKDHWGYVETPFEPEYDQWVHFVSNDEKFDPDLWFLAMDGEEIAGISLCRLESDEDPELGWVNVLGVRRPWRRKGLGLALLQHSFKELWHLGKRGVGLGVDASSLTGALDLYEKAGMHSIRQFDLYEKELRPGRDLTKRSI